MDYLTITDLRINATHGHFEHERRIEQEFVVTLRVGFEGRAAGASDVLGDTIDYDALRAIIEDVFKGKPHFLLEALAEEIVQRILAHTTAQEVTVSIQKTAVWPNGVPGVSITRTRSA
jgi:dihydroneopterin aldolase